MTLSNKRNWYHYKLSFRLTLVVLIWLAALIPAVTLTLKYIEVSYERITRQQLISQANEVVDSTQQLLTESIRAVDTMASEGSIIASVSMDIMSFRAVSQMEVFLASFPMYKSIMLVDDELFQVEALPMEALKLDLLPFGPLVTDIFTSPNTISEPQARYTVVQLSNEKPFLLAVARPILKPKESLTQPFEVASVLLVVAPISEMIKIALETSGISKEELQIKLNFNDKVIYSDFEGKGQKGDFTHQEPLSVGANPPFELTVKQPSSSKLSLYQILANDSEPFIYLVGTLTIILALTFFLTKRLARPLIDLKRVTEQLSSTNLSETWPETILTRSRFKEFDELNLLLESMSKALSWQFAELRKKNLELENTAKALKNSLIAEEQYREISNQLTRFSLDIQREKDVNSLGDMAVQLANFIINKPIGLLLYRYGDMPGYSSLEKAPNAFKCSISSLSSVKLTHAQLIEIDANQDEFRLIPIMIDRHICGYLVHEGQSLQGFYDHSINMLIMALQSFLNQRKLTYQLELKANTDFLTGLSNRHVFEFRHKELLNNYHDQSTRQRDFAIISIDVNGLKAVNDSLGHGAGDVLISAMAELLKEQFRESDMLSRFGGDEFIVLLDNVDSNFCKKVIACLKAKASETPLKYEDKTFEVAFSCGFACTDVDPVDSLLPLADQRMYQDKLEDYRSSLIN